MESERPSARRKRAQFDAWEESGALTREHVERMRRLDAERERAEQEARRHGAALVREGAHDGIEPAQAADGPSDASAVPGAQTSPDGGLLRPSANADGFVLHVLASGSKGNASIVRFGDAAVLVDCGISKKELFARCDEVGFDPFAISAVLVTHEHTDHTKGLGVLMRALAKAGVHPPLLTTAAVHAASRPVREIEDLTEVRHVRASDDFMLAGMHVTSFATSHDSVESMGFRFEADLPDGTRDALGFATDTGVLTDEALACLSDVRLLALESNHDAHLLEVGPYPTALKRRVAGEGGHLSNAQAAEGLERLLSPRLERVVGMHLSETNNEPRLALSASQEVLERERHPARYVTAWQHRAVSLW